MLAVLGRDDTAQDVRELPVVGGTGGFRMAEGYVLWKTANASGADATVQLDVFINAGNGSATVDANAPVSPVDGGGAGSSGSGGSKGGSPSGAAATTGQGGGWARACAVAVVAAVVGSVWW